jgi:hypothetical protein
MKPITSPDPQREPRPRRAERLASHVRANAVAYVALFVALGGTGYAAINLPAGSVGAKQIKNYAITPVKFNHKTLAGSVRAWALVGANGHVLAGEGKPKVVVQKGATAHYSVFWKVESFTRCVAIGGTVAVPGAGAPGFVLPAIATPSGRPQFVGVIVYNALGVEARLPFYVAVLC